MHLEAIDQLLAAWDERLRRIDENLLALEGEPTYQMLSGLAGRRAKLTGTTRERVYPALDALAELFEHRGRLTAVLDHARTIRASISPLTFWASEHKLADVRALLTGPSIAMGSKLVPLAERNLLDPAAREVSVTPEALIAAMVSAYEGAREAVTAVSRAWAEAEPAITQLTSNAAAVRQDAGVMTGDDELTAIEREIAALQDRVAMDPLGIDEGALRTLGARLDVSRERFASHAAVRKQAQAALAHAERQRVTLGSEHAAARRASLLAMEEFEDAARMPPPVDDGLIAGLDVWLEKLRTTVQAGRWSGAQVGLARWQEAADSYVASDRAVVGAYEALTAARAELSGRLSARCAQTRALAGRGVRLDAAAEADAEQARGLLERRPAAVERAAGLIERYEAAVAKGARGERHRR